MASALLGLPKLLRMMRSQRLTLSQAESELRGQVEDCLRIMKEVSKKWACFPTAIPWANVDLPRRDGLTSISLADEEVSKIKKRSPLLQSYEIEVSIPGKKPVQGQIMVPDFASTKTPEDIRLLWSWLADAGGEEGEKLKIALGLDRKNRLSEAWKIREQIEGDSRGVLQALNVLRSSTHSEARKWRSKESRGVQADNLSEAVGLSIRASNYQDEVSTIFQELGRWEEKQREALSECLRWRKALADEEQKWRDGEAGLKKTGKRKGG